MRAQKARYLIIATHRAAVNLLGTNEPTEVSKHMELLSKLFFSNMHTWTDTAPLDNAYRNLDRALLDSNIPDDTLGAIDTLSDKDSFRDSLLLSAYSLNVWAKVIIYRIIRRFLSAGYIRRIDKLVFYIYGVYTRYKQTVIYI